MANEKVRWAVVGLGMGYGRSKLIKETDGAELTAICDIDSNKVKEKAEELGCRAYTDFEELLKDDEVEVVFVVTPSGLHADQGMAALQAGKHAVLTKPMDVSSKKCRMVIDAARRAGKLVAVDFQSRYRDPFQQIRFAVDKGLFGRLILGECRLKWFRAQEYYDSGGWRGTWEMDGGGSLANQTVHFIDQLLWFMGKPKKVWGKYGVYNHEMESEDLGMAMIEFESGAVGTVLGTTTFPVKGYSGVEIHGTTGGVVALEDTSWFFQNPEDEAKLQRTSPYTDVVQDVSAAVRNGGTPLCPGEEGILSVELLEAIYLSSREGNPIDMKSIRE